MASLLHSESRRLYSWWWDSHISPKNSKWLQENLTDMDVKVKAMIKLIEEDADSFARRAEMYYRKRPELMKLVEEFYRAYRALAERYDHATVELRQAHQTMAAAFPDQLPYLTDDGSPSGSAVNKGEHQVLNVPHPIHALLEADDSPIDARQHSPAKLLAMKNSEGLKQLNEMFESEGRTKIGLCIHEADKGESGKGGDDEGQMLKILTELQSEKEAVLLKYQESSEKLSCLEREMKDAEGLDERARRTEIEVKILKETLAKFEADKAVSLCQYQKCLARISSLENMNAQKQEDARGLNKLATKAETKIQNLKQELSRLEEEKVAAVLQYNQCLKTISSLENEICHKEENVRILKEQAERAENEVQALKQALVELNVEKENVELRYEQCLQKLDGMESEMYLAQEDFERLNMEFLSGIAKFKAMEEQCFQLGSSNQSLQLEASNLKEKIAMINREVLEKECAIEKLQNLLLEQQAHVEPTLQTLQKLHVQSQEEQQTLAAELKNGLQMLKDLETCNKNLHEDLQRATEDNETLNKLNNYLSISITNLQNEISSLKEMKGKLEDTVCLQLSQHDSLQLEICYLKEEIGGLSRRYQALTEQVHAVGLDPELLESAVREQQHENLKLKEACMYSREENEVLHKKLIDIDKVLHENDDLEKSLSELNVKLEASREKVKVLQDSSQTLQGEKSSLVDEKAKLLSQLQIMVENMQKLLEKNALLENSLSGANVEIEDLKEKSKSLEQLCQTLETKKSNLANERSTLVSHLERAEQRLEDLGLRCATLGEKCSNLDKEKDHMACMVKDIHSYFFVEKKEHTVNIKSNESRLVVLENQVHVLQEEGRLDKREFEEEVDKAVNAHVEIFVLQKFIEDLEEKYLFLLLECQRHIEGSKLADKLISELESENFMQHMDVEFLSDEIEKLRMLFRQVFKSLQIDPSEVWEDGREEKMPFKQVLDSIIDLRNSVARSEDEKQQVTVEKMVLLTLLEQLELGSAEIKSGKKLLEHEINILMEQNDVLQKDRLELVNERTQLRIKLSKGKQQEEVLKATIDTQRESLLDFRLAYHALQEEHVKVRRENISLLQKLSSLEVNMNMLEEENSSILQEAIVLGSQSSLFESISKEEAEELHSLSLGVSQLHVTNDELRKKANMLGETLELKDTEIQRLNQTIGNLQQEMDYREDLTDQLYYQISIGKDFVRQKINEILDAEGKVKAMENLNADFQITIEKLERKCEESKRMKVKLEKQTLELSNNVMNQQNEIECLREANGNLEMEVVLLSKEIEERRTREENLSSELQERSNEFELLEAEASSFYFDMQISSIHEVLVEKKIHELTAAYEQLNDGNSTKDLEIKHLKQKSTVLESEVGELKARLSRYVPAIASLKGSVESLEQNTLLWTNLSAARKQVQKDVAIGCQKITSEEYPKEVDGVSDLHKLQTQIKSVEKAVIKEIDRLAADKTIWEERDRLGMLGKTDMAVNFATSSIGPEQLYLRGRSDEEYDTQHKGIQLGSDRSRNSRQLKNKPDVFVARKGISMKDIPLDRVSNYLSYSRSKRENSGSDDPMLELWESTEQDYSFFDPLAKDSRLKSASMKGNLSSSYQLKDPKRKARSPSPELQIEKEVGIDKLEVLANINREPNYEGSRSLVLERLASDAQRLMSLEKIVVDLKNKMEKRRSKKARSFEFERAKGQLEEVEEAIVLLIHTNRQLTKDIIKEAPSALERMTAVRSEEAVHVQLKTAAEQAQREREKVGRMQFELESINYILLKLEDEKKSKSKLKFSASRTGIFFRHYIYSGHRSNRRRKRPCFCGCARPSTKED